MTPNVMCLVLLGLATGFFWAAPAAASPYVCPDQLGPGERFIGMSPAGPGVAAVPLCVQDQVARSSSGSAFLRPPAWDNFGAVVSSPHLNDVFLSWNLGSPEEAEAEAMRRCREVIDQPDGCVFEIWVKNQYLAVAQRADGLRFYGASPLFSGAEYEAFAACEKAGIACRIIADLAALPIDAVNRPEPLGYSPSVTDEVRAAYATASWPEDGQSDAVWIARGYGSFADSNAAAVSACTLATGKTCQVGRNNSDTHFVVGMQTAQERSGFVIHDVFEAANAERVVRNRCAEGASCALREIVPTRGPREVVRITAAPELEPQRLASP